VSGFVICKDEKTYLYAKSFEYLKSKLHCGNFSLYDKIKDIYFLLKTRNCLFKRSGTEISFCRLWNCTTVFDFHAEFQLVCLVQFTAAVYISLFLILTAIFTMSKIQEQRICLKFCVSNKSSCAEELKNNRIYEKITHRFYTTIMHLTHQCWSLFGQKLIKYHSSDTIFASLVTFSYSQNSNYHFVESVFSWQRLKRNLLKAIPSSYKKGL